MDVVMTCSHPIGDPAKSWLRQAPGLMITLENLMTAAGLKKTLVGALIAMAGFFAANAAGAGSLPTPAGKPILTISGKISETNKNGAAQFDRPMLEALGMITVETTTPWYDGPVKFEGVSLDKLMKQVGASGERAVVIALNDYSTEIPMEDFTKYNVILALKRNGEYMPISDKGPLFVIYPFDSKPELKTQIYYDRSAWQVARIMVK